MSSVSWMLLHAVFLHYAWHVYLSAFLSACRSVYLSAFFSVCLFIYLAAFLHYAWHVYLSAFLSTCLSVCLSVYLSAFLSVCLCLSCCFPSQCMTCLSLFGRCCCDLCSVEHVAIEMLINIERYSWKMTSVAVWPRISAEFILIAWLEPTCIINLSYPGLSWQFLWLAKQVYKRSLYNHHEYVQVWLIKRVQFENI